MSENINEVTLQKRHYLKQVAPGKWELRIWDGTGRTDDHDKAGKFKVIATYTDHQKAEAARNEKNKATSGKVDVVASKVDKNKGDTVKESIEKIVNAALEQNAAEFESLIHAELAERTNAAIDARKTDIAAALTTSEPETQEETE